MNRLSTQDRARILTALSEGVGINAACRIAGVSKNTALKLLADVGEACSLYQDRVMRDLQCTQIQADEIWSFVGMKQKNAPEGLAGVWVGDCYTFTAIDPVTKLMPCWLVGHRTAECTDIFIRDLAKRLAGRVQLTTDGMIGYPAAVARHFGANVDYGVLNKTYEGGLPAVEAKRRYSPAICTGATKQVVCGAPDMDKISTSHVERSNLTLRMGSRRFTRLTNAFSKKFENHMHAVSFHFMIYNFVKVHGTVKTTPAMAAGVADYRWTMEDIVTMADTMND
jgi:transposase-like protein